MKSHQTFEVMNEEDGVPSIRDQHGRTKSIQKIRRRNTKKITAVHDGERSNSYVLLFSKLRRVFHIQELGNVVGLAVVVVCANLLGD